MFSNNNVIKLVTSRKKDLEVNKYMKPYWKRTSQMFIVCQCPDHYLTYEKNHKNVTINMSKTK